jgi:hypothetical protein
MLFEQKVMSMLLLEYCYFAALRINLIPNNNVVYMLSSLAEVSGFI